MKKEIYNVSDDLAAHELCAGWFLRVNDGTVFKVVNSLDLISGYRAWIIVENDDYYDDFPESIHEFMIHEPITDSFIQQQNDKRLYLVLENN